MTWWHQTKYCHSHLQNAVSGWGPWDSVITTTFCHRVPALLLVQAILPTVVSDRDLRVLHMVKMTLRGQLGELCEEPVTVFEETILMDSVEIVPVFICPAVVFLCKEKQSVSCVNSALPGSWTHDGSSSRVFICGSETLFLWRQRLAVL